MGWRSGLCVAGRTPALEDSALRRPFPESQLYLVAATVLKYSYLIKVIMRIINWGRLTLMNCGMFATFGIALLSMLQTLGENPEDSVHSDTKHISLSSQQLFG